MATLNPPSGLVKAPLSSPGEVLDALAGLLTCRSSKSPQQSPKNYEWADIPWENSSSSRSQSGEPEEGACDFSSFPSLSLQKKMGAASNISGDQILFHGKEGVEARVAALLARPVLVSNGQNVKCSAIEESDDESSEFMEAFIADVPALMQQNLVLSFSTLVQSRLRAYATFLARHGLSVAKSKSVEELEERVLSVNQKLETMLEIGNLVFLSDVQTSFATQTGKADTSLDGDDLKVSLPLSMRASIQVVIPNLEGKAGSLSLDIEAAGTITGVFSGVSETPMLGVVQLDLNMDSLLDQMKKGAAKTVSCILDNTITGLSLNAVPVPHSDSEQIIRADGKRRLRWEDESEVRKRQPHVIPEDRSIITPDLQSIPATSPPSDLDLSDDVDDALSTLSPDRCGKILDCLLDEMDVTVLTPPSKRMKFSQSDDANASTLLRPQPPIA